MMGDNWDRKQTNRGVCVMTDKDTKVKLRRERAHKDLLGWRAYNKALMRSRATQSCRIPPGYVYVLKGCDN